MLRLFDLWYIMHFLWHSFDFGMIRIFSLFSFAYYYCFDYISVHWAFYAQPRFLSMRQVISGNPGSSDESRSLADLPFSFPIGFMFWTYVQCWIFIVGLFTSFYFLWTYVGFCNVLSREVHDLYNYEVFRLRIILVCMLWYDTIMWYFSHSRVGVLQLWYQSLGFDL